MLVDAAYSGDWSRIGAISKETERALQQVGDCTHGAGGVVAVVVALLLHSCTCRLCTAMLQKPCCLCRPL